MKFLNKITVLLVILAVNLPAFGMGYVNGRVSKIRVYQAADLAIVEFDRDITGETPRCVNEAHKRSLALDTTTPGGRTLLTLVMDAKNQEKEVVAYGKGMCGLNYVTETLEFLEVQ